jgi:hypothetical protein
LTGVYSIVLSAISDFTLDCLKAFTFLALAFSFLISETASTTGVGSTTGVVCVSDSG